MIYGETGNNSMLAGEAQCCATNSRALIDLRSITGLTAAALRSLREWLQVAVRHRAEITVE